MIKKTSKNLGAYKQQVIFFVEQEDLEYSEKLNWDGRQVWGGGGECADEKEVEWQGRGL